MKRVGKLHRTLMDLIKNQVYLCSVRRGILQQILVIFQDIKNSILYARKKTCGELYNFGRKDLFLKALEASISNTGVSEHIKVKRQSPKKKTVITVGIYRAPSHGIQARFLSEVEEITSSSFC